MKIFKNIFKDFYIYMLWGLAAWVIVGFVYGRIEYEPASKKVVITIDAEVKQTELSVELEKNMPEGIKQVRAYSLDYFMFDDGTLEYADMLVFNEEGLKKYAELFAELDKSAFPAGTEFYEYEGQTLGILLNGEAKAYIGYGEGNYYLVFNKKSLHANKITGTGDDAAFTVYETFMKLK